MKKFLSLLCAVAIALSASAVPSLKGQKKGLKFDKELPQIENVKKQGVVNPLFKASKSIAKAPAAKQNLDSVDYAEAAFLGTYYQAYDQYLVSKGGTPQYEAYYMDWQLKFFSGEDFAGALIFSYPGEATNKIAGEYEEVEGYVVFAAGDTADVVGALGLTALDFEGNYQVQVQVSDAQGRAWDTTFTAEIFAYDYYIARSKGIDYAVITLDDYEIAPTGDKDTLVVSAGYINDKIADAGWWVFGGYTADSVYVQLSNAGTTDHIVGTYAFADLDATYSYIEIEGAQIFFSDAQFTITQADNNTYHAVGSAMGKNGIEYVITIDEEYIAPSENVISINYDSNNRALTYSPSISGEYYFFYIVEKSALDEMVSEYSQDSLAPVVNALVSYMVQQQVIGYYVDSVAISVDVVAFMGEHAATGDYIALAAPISDYGKVNGQIAYKEFRFDYPEALEDAKAEEKAIKKFENGQLIIEKNGVKYNALGVRL